MQYVTDIDIYLLLDTKNACFNYKAPGIIMRLYIYWNILEALYNLNVYAYPAVVFYN